MSESISNQKKMIRKEYRHLRSALGELVRNVASVAICERLGKWDIFHSSKVILTYLPIRAEVDLQMLIGQHPEKTWVLPRILPGDDHQMAFHPFVPGRLVTHPFGMAEPEADLPVVPTSDVELALVPGLAYDRQGWRLGYGGGFYDRFLKDFHGTSAGIIFGALLVESLPHDENDVAMNWIMTETGLLKIEGEHYL